MLSSIELIELAKQYSNDDSLASVIIVLASARIILEKFDIPDAEFSLLEACVENSEKINKFVDELEEEVNKANKYESN